jgi:hypothetical protein
MKWRDRRTSMWQSIAAKGVAFQRFGVHGTYPAPIAAHPGRGIGGIDGHWLAVDGQFFVYGVRHDGHVVAEQTHLSVIANGESRSVYGAVFSIPASDCRSMRPTPCAPVTTQGSSLSRMAASPFFSLMACQYCFSNASNSSLVALLIMIASHRSQVHARRSLMSIRPVSRMNPPFTWQARSGDFSEATSSGPFDEEAVGSMNGYQTAVFATASGITFAVAVATAIVLLFESMSDASR